MQSIKVANRFLLGSVAFGVSFLLGLLANRDITKALLTGFITIPDSYTGAMIADKRRIYQEKLLRGSLQNQIEELAEEQTQLYQSLAAATATRQDVEASINALQGERSHLLSRVSELHIQRNELYRELSDFQKQKQQQDLEFYNLQTQLQKLERQQTEINQSLSAKNFQLQQTESRISQLRKELDQLHNQISNKKQQKEQLHPDLAKLESRKQHLEGSAYDLQTQIQVLQQRQDQLNQALLPLQAQYREMEGNLLAGKARLDQLLSQISEKQKQQKKLNQDLATLENRKQNLEAESHNLQTQIQALETQQLVIPQASPQELKEIISILLPQEWREWLEFAQHLSEDEQRAFQAILEQDIAALKRIADKNSTMPEVLIESINEKALNTFGDTLFVSRGVSIIPEIHEDYYSIFTDSISLSFKDFLGFKNVQSYVNSTVIESSESSSTSLT